MGVARMRRTEFEREAEKLKSAKSHVTRIINSDSTTKRKKTAAIRKRKEIDEQESQLALAHYEERRRNHVPFQACTGCGKSKPIDDSYFGFGKKSTKKPKSRCKACIRKDSATYHFDNMELGRERSKINRVKRRDTGGHVTEEEKIERRRKQKDKCAYCGVKLKNGGELDHYYPIEHGGTHSINNCVWACRTCNLNKGRKTPEEFLLWWKETSSISMRRGGFYDPSDERIAFLDMGVKFKVFGL